MSTVIVSVGTSLLTNRETSTGRPWHGWNTGDPLPDHADAVAYLMRADPVLASAETNTLDKLNLAAGDLVYWLHSDTEEGRFCAEVLRSSYERRGYSGKLRGASGIGYSARTLAEHGLRSLVSEAMDIIKTSRSSGTVCICATGGFKAEMAYLTLVGLLSGCPVHYIHEQFKELVTLPALPINWDTAWVERNIAFFEWMDNELRPAPEVESRLKAAPELQALVHFEEGLAYLSAAGLALYEAYLSGIGARAAWPAESKRPPFEKFLVSAEQHHRPKGWERFIECVAGAPWVEAIRYSGGSPTPSGSRITVLDPEKGVLKAVYSSDYEVHFEIETTARGAEQCGLVADWLRRKAKRIA